MGSRLEDVLRAGEAHRRRSTRTGALDMEDFNDDALRFILDKIVGGNPREACEAVANWCALNTRHRAMCQDGGNAMWATLTRRLFGPNVLLPTGEDLPGVARQTFQALCARAAAYRQGERMLKDHPEDKKVSVFVNAAREGIYYALEVSIDDLGQARPGAWDSADAINGTLFGSERGMGEWHRANLRSILRRLATLFENLAILRRKRGQDLDHAKELASLFFVHAIVFQVALRDLENTIKYQHWRFDKEDKRKELYRLQDAFRRVLVRAMVAVLSSGGARSSEIVDAYDIVLFYRNSVRETLPNSLQLGPLNRPVSMQELDDAADQIVSFMDSSTDFGPWVA